jgi:hypothetical protein
MTRALRCGSLIGVLMVGLACGTERPRPARSRPHRPPRSRRYHPLGRRPHSRRANPLRRTFSTAHSMTPFAVLRPDRNTSCTKTECSGCDMTPSAMCIWAHIDRTTPPSPSCSMHRPGTAWTRPEPSREISSRSAIAKSCNTRTSRMPSTGESSSRHLEHPEHYRRPNDCGPKTA